MDAEKPVINLADVALRENGNGDAFVAKIGSFAHQIGSTGIGCMLHEVPPGKKAFPFHNHHALHELFYVLEGEGTYRFGDKIYPIRAGDVLAAPAGGPEMAHQIINTGDKPLRYLGISTMADTEVIEYPDSGKFAAISRSDWNHPEAGGIRFVGRAENALGYWDGET
ncbi:cupin domain-containing protein [Bauldia sp.]|uniref:cupin domain-containing protein n=1 Tax=Bauldia sp. TaxID=2575872 RepID=UPI003BA9AFF4